jgi:peroxiredoxin Q/BCP
MLAWFADLLPVGSPAPDFTLADQDGSEITLSKLRGRDIVLVFYPGDNTRVCTKQLCEFRDRQASGWPPGTAVFGINPQGAKSHVKFRQRYNLSFPLLVDSGGKVASLYHAGGWLVRRTVYLVDKDGNIRFAKRGMPNPQDVLAVAR